MLEEEAEASQISCDARAACAVFLLKLDEEISIINEQLVVLAKGCSSRPFAHICQDAGGSGRLCSEERPDH